MLTGLLTFYIINIIVDNIRLLNKNKLFRPICYTIVQQNDVSKFKL
jgi:hypothetical protein